MVLWIFASSLLAQACTRSTDELCIGTWNLWKLGADERSLGRAQGIAQAITDSEAAAVVLQEVNVTGHEGDHPRNATLNSIVALLNRRSGGAQWEYMLFEKDGPFPDEQRLGLLWDRSRLMLDMDLSGSIPLEFTERFRVFAITDASARGVPLTKISRDVGHATIESTLQYQRGSEDLRDHIAYTANLVPRKARPS